MSPRTRRLPSALVGLVALALVAAACTAGTSEPGGSASTGADGSASTGADQTWRTTALRDVRTGKEFTIDELRGKLVAIEPMAIWCSNCRTQQREAAAALAATPSDGVVYISVSVDPGEQPEALAAYSRTEGFDWIFVVASREVARSLAAAFGDQVLSPPSTPLILVGPDGAVIDVHFGIRSASELTALFAQHLP